MKINNVGKLNLNPYQKQMDKQAELKKASVKQDKIEISAAAKEMLKGDKISAERGEKVNTLKEQVQSGDYKVNPEAVAKKMLESLGIK